MNRHPDCAVEKLTVWDFPESIRDALETGGIGPDWLADDIARLMNRGYSNDAVADFVKCLRMNAEPIVEKYGI